MLIMNKRFYLKLIIFYGVFYSSCFLPSSSSSPLRTLYFFSWGSESSAWLFQVSSVTSAAFVAGFYHWQLEAVRTSDSERLVVERGTFTAIADLDINGADPRTHAEIMVDKIQAVLENRADSDVDDYSIAGRSLTKMKVKDLLYWRDYYRAEVLKEKRQELINRGKRVKSTVKVRF